MGLPHWLGGPEFCGINLSLSDVFFLAVYSQATGTDFLLVSLCGWKRGRGCVVCLGGVQQPGCATWVDSRLSSQALRQEQGNMKIRGVTRSAIWRKSHRRSWFTILKVLLEIILYASCSFWILSFGGSLSGALRFQGSQNAWACRNCLFWSLEVSLEVTFTELLVIGRDSHRDSLLLATSSEFDTCLRNRARIFSHVYRSFHFFPSTEWAVLCLYARDGVCLCGRHLGSAWHATV